ncbi:hypothetical protein DFJ77DRAFT_473606 [Powellomyces hirtus]|nr:hypothetical protein DFJ77DRAFT_473606 [Powellomyces hirtus]
MATASHRPLTPAVKLAPLIHTARVTEYAKLDDGKVWYKLTVFPKQLAQYNQGSNNYNQNSPVTITPPQTPPRTSRSRSRSKSRGGNNNNNNGNLNVNGSHGSYSADAAAAHSLPYCIFRRYEHFVDFHAALSMQIKRDTTAHPAATKPHLPSVPKSKLFVTRTVCDDRVVRLDEYVRLLLDMDQRITRNVVVAEFFGVWPRDANDGAIDTAAPADDNNDEIGKPRSRRSEDIRVRHAPQPAKSALKSSTTRDRYHRHQPKPISDDEDVDLDEAWLKPVQEKRASRMLLEAGSFGPGLNTLLRDGTKGTGVQTFFARKDSLPDSDTVRPAPPVATEQIRKNSVGQSHIQPAAAQSFTTATTAMPASPTLGSHFAEPPPISGKYGMTLTQVPQRKDSVVRGPMQTARHIQSGAAPHSPKFSGPSLDIPHRSHSRNWSSSSPSPVTASAGRSSSENNSPVFSGASSPNRGTPVGSGYEYFPRMSESTSSRSSQDTIHQRPGGSPPKATTPAPMKMYEMMGGALSAPLLTSDNPNYPQALTNPTTLTRGTTRSRRPTLLRTETTPTAGPVSPEIEPSPATTTMSNDIVSSPASGSSVLPSIVTSTLERPSRIVVVSQAPVGLAEPRTALTLTRHHSTPTLERPDVPTTPQSEVAPPMPVSAEPFQRHADLAPPSLHRALTDPFITRRTPSPEDRSAPSPVPMSTTAANPASSLPLHLKTIPNIPTRKPSLLARAKTQLGRANKTPSPPPVAQDPDDPTIPPWNRIGRSNSVKNGIIYNNDRPMTKSSNPPGTLLRARTVNTVFSMAEDTSTLARGISPLPMRTATSHRSHTHSMRDLPPPRRSHTLTSATTLPSHFIHLKAQYTADPTTTTPPITILLKVSRTTQLGVVTARLQEKFSAVLAPPPAPATEPESGMTAAAPGIRVLGLTYLDEEGCQIEVCDEEDWLVLCAAAQGKVVVGVRVDPASVR